MEWIWIGVIISLVLIELISLNLTSICFIISAIVSFIELKLKKDYNIQFCSFLIIGCFLLLFIRPIIMSKIKDKRDKFVERIVTKHPFIGKILVVDISQNNKENKKTNENNNVKKK